MPGLRALPGIHLDYCERNIELKKPQSMLDENKKQICFNSLSGLAICFLFSYPLSITVTKLQNTWGLITVTKHVSCLTDSDL